MDGSPTSLRAVFVLTVMTSLLSVTVSEGQTTSITSSGLGTKVTLNGGAPVPTYDITGGTRPGNGTNLFHSFGEFSVGTHDIARFGNDSGLPTANILSRVTGGQTSNIYGAIQTSGFGTAALWLINPAGIVFGPSASLNVGGSVHFSTADYLRLGSGNDRFYADLGKTSQLTSAPVTAFGFLGNSSGKIDVQGGVGSSTLSGSEGNSLSLVGGDISIEGRTIQASGGQINLVSVSAGEVSLTPNGPQLSQGSVLGTISLTAKPPDAVNQFPTHTVLTANVSELNSQAGDIFIRSGHLVMDDSSLSAFAQTASSNDPNGFTSGGNILVTATNMNLSKSTLTVSTSGNTAAGSMTLQGQDIVLQNTTLRAPSNLSLNDFVREPTGGRAGSITIGGINGPAHNVTISNGTIDTHINTAGAPGTPPSDIQITSQVVTLTDHASITATSLGAAPGGNINIDTGMLTMNPGTSIAASTSGSGNGGNISITASDLVTLSGSGTKVAADTSSAGSAGTITINTNQLAMASGGQISSSSIGTSTTGGAGQITIQGQSGAGSSAQGIALTDSFIRTTVDQGASTSSSATIDIRAQSVTLANASIINAQTKGTAPAGNIVINAATLSMNPRKDGGEVHGSDIVTSTIGSGKAGDITIDATEQVNVSGSVIESSSFQAGTGAAGKVKITTPALTVEEGGWITSSTLGSGGGGSVELNVGNLVIRNSQSGFPLCCGVTSDTSGSGDAGSILVNVNQLTMTDGGRISSQSIGTSESAGSAGQILVRGRNGEGSSAQSVTLDNSTISTTISGGTAANTPATIDLTAQTISLANKAKITADTSSAGSAGTITINTNQLAMASGGQISSSSIGTSTTGGAGQITIQGQSGAGSSAQGIDLANSFILTTVDEGISTSSPAAINIAAQAVTLKNGSRIDGRTNGPAPGGSINVGAGTVSMTGSEPQPGGPSLIPTIETNTGGTGRGGDITIDADDVTVFGGKIGSASINGGQAGNVTIRAPALTLESVEARGLLNDSGIITRTSGSGAGGTISLEVGSLLIRHSNVPASPTTVGALSDGVTADTTGSGAGGNINITADSIQLERGLITANASRRGPGETGAPGNIDISVGQLALVDGSMIRAGNSGTTPGGAITIHGKGSALADIATISNSTLFTGTASTAKGGPLSIAANTINATDGAVISSSSSSVATGAGDAGNINLTSTDNISITNSTVSTSATQASGGNIEVTAPNIVRLIGANLTSSVAGPPGSNGGNITINTAHPQFVIMQGNSQILAKANEGQGGAITIIGGVVLQEPGSVLDATAGPAGISGTINIQAPIQQLSGAIAPLPQAFAVATNLYGQRCAAEKGGQFSSFVQGARDGVPPQPGDLIPSPLLLESDSTSPILGSKSSPSLAAVRLGLPAFDYRASANFISFAGCRS